MTKEEIIKPENLVYKKPTLGTSPVARSTR